MISHQPIVFNEAAVSGSSYLAGVTMKLHTVGVNLLMPLILISALISVEAHGEVEESNSPTWQQLDPAWTGVSDKIVDFVGEDKQKLLANLAYAAVASDLCQDLKLDKIKFQKAFDGGFAEKNQSTMPAAELAAFGQKVSMYFGVYVGLLTADGMLERDSFCDAAYQAVAKNEDVFWLANSASRPTLK
ncbi:MAG: hypothetical protein CTY19_16625 [Methylomonas sp.]|nr:MAG: hypothetical protein CTY19_16625 [Methylomonas sp.]